MPNGIAAASTGLSMERVLQTVGGILLTICTAISGWAVTGIIENSERLTRIESSRYTLESARTDQLESAQAIRSVWKEISAIREDLAARPRISPQDLAEINTRLALIEQSLKAIEKR